MERINLPLYYRTNDFYTIGGIAISKKVYLLYESVQKTVTNFILSYLTSMNLVLINPSF